VEVARELRWKAIRAKIVDIGDDAFDAPALEEIAARFS
jgi:hypothetical protein